MGQIVGKLKKKSSIKRNHQGKRNHQRKKKSSRRGEIKEDIIYLNISNENLI